jgi:glycine C-acetyltransferase
MSEQNPPNKPKDSFVGENFDLRELPIDGGPEQVHLMNIRHLFSSQIQQNIEVFDSIHRPLNEKGYLLYHRKICSPADRTVWIEDMLTGQKREMLMFGSNNYLGFANEPKIRQRVHEALDKHGIGMAGPMILNGTSSLHRELERRLAKFKGKEDAVVLPSGYQANLAWVNSLMTDDAILLYDEASHASLIDAVRLGRRKAFRFESQKLETLEHLLKKYADGKRDLFVSIQGVYSMTGEISQVPDILQMAEKYEAQLVIDDAHGTGVLGKGRGTAEHFGVSKRLRLSMGTFSKSFAVTGGFLAADEKTINFIRFFARPYFFTAAISPLIASAVLAGIDLIENEPDRVERLHKNIARFRELLVENEIGHTFTGSAIFPVFPPVAGKFREISLALHESGLFVNPIEPPAVPVGRERFRVSVIATHTEADLQKAVSILKNVFKEFT